MREGDGGEEEDEEDCTDEGGSVVVVDESHSFNEKWRRSKRVSKFFGLVGWMKTGWDDG